MRIGQCVEIVRESDAFVIGTYEHDGETIRVYAQSWYVGHRGVFAGRDASRPLRPMMVEIAGEGVRWFTVPEVAAVADEADERGGS